MSERLPVRMRRVRCAREPTLQWEAHTPAPELRYEHTALWVEFRFLLEHTVSATPKITGEVTGEVTREVERLVLALQGPMSRVQIQQALGLRHEDHFRAKYLIPALQSGLREAREQHRNGQDRREYLSHEGPAITLHGKKLPPCMHCR